MKYYLVAGEASGDMHGANLMKELRALDPQASFRFWGGDLMAAVAGCPPVKHYKELAFMGITEVLTNLRTILNNLKYCKQDIVDFTPDVLILVDYPGFNLRLADFAHSRNIKVAYYISPTIWAWKESRVQIVKRAIDRMMLILPFEEAFYARHHYRADYVGHPLLDVLKAPVAEQYSPGQIALVPGSRVQEIKRVLPVMVEAAKQLPDYRFVVAAAPHIPEDLYRSLLGSLPAELQWGQMHSVLKHSELAWVTSGTATLETALLNVPQVVCYKAGALSYQIGRHLVKVKYISLVNLILDRPVVAELLQHELNAGALLRESRKLIVGSGERQAMLDAYGELRQALGGPGASARAAAVVMDLLTA